MNPLVRCCLAEGIGTFTLTFIGAGAIIATGNIVAIALAHGLALSMAVYWAAPISGGHINPAVTIAMLVRKRMKREDALGYVGAQVLGGMLAAILVNACFPETDVVTGKLGATLGGLSYGSGFGVLFVELILTFFLVTTIFAFVVDKRGPKNLYGFAIGLTLAFCILCANPLTGASLNPARSFGPALIGGHWAAHWAYWVGPIAGGCLAAIVYDTVFLGGEGKKKSAAKQKRKKAEMA